MGKFLTSEKPRLADFKARAAYISEAAREDGVYRNNSYPFCLPQDCAHENLFPEIRDSIREYFQKFEIKWHDGEGGNPSNHLCDSQVCCANYLFPFSDKPQALATLLRSIYPSIEKALPVENGLHVAFEWIGQMNYLKEKISRNGKRTRGANFTSADAMVRFQHADGKKQVVLIEWKYTESYYSTFLKYARKSGTDRTEIYVHLYDADEDLLDTELLPCFDALFYEPFYQLMRQQYLANEMEKARELEADIVSLLHIAPGHNTDFRRITSPSLLEIGDSATDVWGKLVKKPGRFASVTTEDLFGKFEIDGHPELAEWYEYITERYSWLVG